MEAGRSENKVKSQQQFSVSGSLGALRGERGRIMLESLSASLQEVAGYGRILR